MKIKTTKPSRFGQKVTTSMGVVAFDEKGFAEVKDFEALSKVMRHIKLADDTSGENEGDKDKGKSTGSAGVSSSTGSGKIDLSKLKLMTDEELFEIASQIEGVNMKSIKKMKAAGLIKVIETSLGEGDSGENEGDKEGDK